jgi:two-component system response regulator AtoC
LRAAQRVADRDVTVLIEGETGTGKEAIASLVHAYSRRSKKPLIRFNCAAVTESLAQAELFGFEKGAFTGAGQRHEGFFRRAHGGTLVLDEVSELPAPVQSSILRALQEGEVQAHGSKRVEKVDVRVIACTNVPLLESVRVGRFREDLYYRLNVVQLTVPPLRERHSDVPLLARHFQVKYAERFGLSDVPLPASVIEQFCRQSWPGNVRELEISVAKLLALSEDGVVDESELAQRHSGAGATVPEGSLRERVANFERRAIEAALDASDGNQSEAARRSRTTRTTLIDKMKRLGLSTRRDPEHP